MLTCSKHYLFEIKGGECSLGCVASEPGWRVSGEGETDADASELLANILIKKSKIFWFSVPTFNLHTLYAVLKSSSAEWCKRFF